MSYPAPIQIRAALILLAAGLFPALTTAAPPNIVVFFSDDHARHAISAYQDLASAEPQSLLFKDWAPMRTPNIDRLADEGIVFTNSYVSNSVCKPSRASLLTGLHSHANGQLSNIGDFDGSQQTVPKLLQAAGYNTALIGKWHLGTEPTGFDHYERLINQGAYYDPLLRTTQPGGGLVNTTYTGEYVADVITDRTKAWLQARIDGGRTDPFFLMVNHKGAHRNWEPAPQETDPAAFRAVEWDFSVTPNPDTHPGKPELWTPADSPRPANFTDYLDGYPTRTDGARMQLLEIAGNIRTDSDLKLEGTTTFGGTAYDEVRAWWAANSPSMSQEEKERHYQRRYLNEYALTARSVDRSVGDILDFLEANDLDHDTIILYSSDQGFFLGEHGWFDKRWIYEESLWTPLLMQWKDASGASLLPSGSQVTEPVQVIDYGPTLLAAAGITGFQPMHGESFLGLATTAIGDEPADWRDGIYYHYYNIGGVAVNSHYGIRTDRYKLIYHYESSQWEFFDLQSDPTEMNNLFYDDVSGTFDDPTDGIEGTTAFKELVGGLMLDLRNLTVHYADDNGPDFTIPGADVTDLDLLLNLTANVAEYEGGRTATNSPNVAAPVPGSGLAFHVNFTPQGQDLFGTVLLIEIGGTANGSGLYLVDGVPTFISKQSSDNADVPQSLADTELNEVAAQSSFGILEAGVPYRVGAVYVPPTTRTQAPAVTGDLRLAVQPVGGNITADGFVLTNAGNRLDWSGNESLSIGSPDSVSSSAGALADTGSDGGTFDRTAVKALAGSVDRGLYWNSVGLAASKFSTTGISRSVDGFDIGIQRLIKGATYRLFRDTTLPFDGDKVEVDSVVAGDGPETLSDQSLAVPFSGRAFYKVFEER